MAIGPLLLPLVALVLSSSACQNPKPGQKDSVAVLAGDTTQHVLPAEARALVLRARELDRADSLDAATGMAQSCPILEGGGTGEVYEALEM